MNLGIDVKRESKCFTFSVETHEFFILKKAVMLFAIQQGSYLPKVSDRGQSEKQETEKRKWFYKPPENLYR